MARNSASTVTRTRAPASVRSHTRSQPRRRFSAKPRPAREPLPRLLTVEETARELRICRASCFALIGRGELGSILAGRRRLVPAAAIERFIAEQLDGGSAE